MLLDHELMYKAIELAEKAFAIGEAPIGAVIVDENGEIIGSGFNKREKLQSPIAHAEIIAIEKAARFLKTWRLDNCTIYVTLEPCLMCAGAMMQARLKRIVYGAYADKTGALSSVTNVYENGFGYTPMVRSGVLENECAEIMSRFGEGLRRFTTED
ncbi:MAG: nucleoside deaminase [Oscillospiraceae bacterium]|nr:nucleoside deaminase [Oscillospiraceae bacterium]